MGEGYLVVYLFCGLEKNMALGDKISAVYL